MPRYVILWHQKPPGSRRISHWDLMLETRESLRTWALIERPRVGAVMPCEALEDHRTAYLDYEGAVSRNRGSVAQWDQGTFDWLLEMDQLILVTLRGAKLSCNAEFTVGRGQWSLRLLALN